MLTHELVAAPEGLLQMGPPFPATRLSQIETWITNPHAGQDSWGQVKPFLFVRLTLSDGQTGWGEAFVLPCREKAVAEIIHALGAALAAQDHQTPRVLRDLAARISDKHRGLDFSAATSALEIALWDIHGKQMQKPLRELLGGHRNGGIPIYANIWSETQWRATDLVNRAKQLRSQGYTALKIHPFQNHTLEEATDAVAMVRAAIGPDTRLMVDLDSCLDAETALRFADRIAPYAPYWLEEPTDGGDVDALARVAHGTALRIVTGERQCSGLAFKAILGVGAAGILNPDIAGLGGILDMLDLAALAEQKGVALSPHCWNSMTVACSAMLHLCAALPNAEMAEIYPEYLAFGEQFARVGYTLHGAHATLSDAHGLGVEMDAEALHAYADAYQENRFEHRMVPA
jgi:galactonate dehydratase